jgi:RING finger family protein
MERYHRGPYQQMSPSGFPGFLLMILAIVGLWRLLPNHQHFYIAIPVLALLGGILAIFLRKYFRRQARAEEISLLHRTEEEFQRPNKKLSSAHYDALFTDASADTACPYCKNHFQPSDLVMLCDKCKSVHHLDCWNANSGCGIFGCEEKRASKIKQFIRN